MKTFLLCAILSSFFSCGKNYQTTPFSDPAWPTATISRIDYSWPEQDSMLPPSLVVFDNPAEGALHSYLVISIGPAKNGSPITWIHFGWSTQEISLDRPLPPDTFAVVAGFPIQGSRFKFSTRPPGTSECLDQTPTIDDREGQLRLEKVLNLGVDAANHFKMYPNYEQPFPIDIRQRIQQLFIDMHSFPENWKSNGC